MAGTTSNYGFPYPTSTDYVRNGATAIQSLADGLDAFISDSEAANKLFDRVLNSQISTNYSQTATTTFSAFATPSALQYTFTLGKSGVALISFGGNQQGGTAGITYYTSPDITGASISGFGAAQGQSIVSVGTTRVSGGCTLVVDGTPGGTVTVKIQAKTSSGSSTITLYDHFITALLLG